MSGRLDGKVAIVTGGGTGIGEAICRRFAREGAWVVVNGMPTDPVQDVVEAIERERGRAVACAADVATEAGASACIQRTLSHFGKLDVLINNAGVLLANAETQDMPVETFDEQLRCNTRTAFLMTRLALPHLRETRGNVICAGSEAGVNGQPQNTVYGATKAFLHAFVLGVAVEQARHGVRANCVCPGPTDTAWTHAETGVVDENLEKGLLAATPLGRRGTVEEIANVYTFLASDEASFVTGALWLVDGGITPAKGAIGELAEKSVATPPHGRIDLQHTHDGTRNKNLVRIPT